MSWLLLQAWFNLKICPSDPKISIKCWMVSPVEPLFQQLVMNQHFLSSHWGKRDLFYVDDFNLKFDCIFSSLSKMCYTCLVVPKHKYFYNLFASYSTAWNYCNIQTQENCVKDACKGCCKDAAWTQGNLAMTAHPRCVIESKYETIKTKGLFKMRTRPLLTAANEGAYLPRALWGRATPNQW